MKKRNMNGNRKVVVKHESPAKAPVHQSPVPTGKHTAVDPLTPQSQQQGQIPLSATVVAATTEEPPFPVSELNSPSLQASLRGWVSGKLCQYPQEVVFRFDGEVDLAQLQILAHESKIPSRLEVLVAGLAHDASPESNPEYPPTLNEARFKRLGFLSFISNEKTKYRSREKKTVVLSAKAYLLKLILHKCHMNALNSYNQVGLIHVQANGQMLTPLHQHRVVPQLPGPSGGGVGLPPIRKSPTPGQQFGDQHVSPIKGVSFMDPQSPLPPVGPPSGGKPGGGGRHQHGGGGADYTPAPPHAQYDQGGGYNQGGGYTDPYQDDQQHGGVPDYSQAPGSAQGAAAGGFRSQAILNFENWHVQKTRYLVHRKTQSVQEEDYDISKICRDQLLHLSQLTNQIYEYENTKVQAIYDEDFDSAKTAKLRMDKLLDKVYSIIDPEQQLQMDQERYPEKNRRQQYQAGGGYQGDQDDDTDDGYPPAAVGGSGGGANAFEDQPVTSKYAQEMAQKVQKSNPKKGKKGKKGGKKQKQQHQPPPQEEEEEDDEQEQERQEEEDDEEREEEREERQEDDEEEAEEEPEEEEDEEEEPKKKASKKRGGGGHARASNRKQPTDDKTSIGAPPPGPNMFDVDSFEEWERAVFFAIQDELGGDQPHEATAGAQDEEGAHPAPGSASDVPVDPRDAAEHTFSGEMRPILGEFATGCLLSRRWKHREAAIKVLSKLTGHLYPHHPTSTVVSVILRYFDLKGFGLLDPILVCFLSSSEFLAKVVEGRFPDCPLSTVNTPVLHLIPRLIFRSSDSTAKSREEALTLLLGCTKSSLGYERVGQAILADPVDADKRKIPPQNFRVYLTRLMILQTILDDAGVARSHLTVDAIMNKLLIPCLNHSNSEVRELAITVSGGFDVNSQQEVFKYVHLIQNPSTKAAVDEKLGMEPVDRHTDTGGGGGEGGGPKHKKTKPGQSSQ